MYILMRINKRCQVNVSGMDSRLQHWSDSGEASKQILAKLRLIYMKENKMPFNEEREHLPNLLGGIRRINDYGVFGGFIGNQIRIIVPSPRPYMEKAIQIFLLVRHLQEISGK